MLISKSVADTMPLADNRYVEAMDPDANTSWEIPSGTPTVYVHHAYVEVAKRKTGFRVSQNYVEIAKRKYGMVIEHNYVEVLVRKAGWQIYES